MLQLLPKMLLKDGTILVVTILIQVSLRKRLKFFDCVKNVKICRDGASNLQSAVNQLAVMTSMYYDE